MSGQILVPLKKHDRIEEILFYLDVLARPEMKVVFLTPYRGKVSWMEVELTAMQTGIKSITAITKLAVNASLEEQLRWVEERIRPAREALQMKGTTVIVQCYTGSLRNTIASLRDPDRELIVLLSEHYQIIRKLIAQFRKLFGRFSTSDTTPILFLRPRRQH
jgi:hypothetical protein